MAARKNAMTSKPQAASTQKTVTLRVDLSLYGEGRSGKLGESWIAGRLVARRPDWDKPVELGKDVTLVKGGFRRWEGTSGRPALGSDYPTVVDIHGVPQAAAEKAEREYPIITRVVVAKGDTVVGAWQRTQTERIPGMGARADAKMAGRPAPEARPASSAKPAAGAWPAAPPKAAAKTAAKAPQPARPARPAPAAAKPKAAPKAKPAPARKPKPAAKPARPKAKAKARPAPRPKARAKAKAKPARPARKPARRPAKPARRGRRGRR